MNVIQSEWWKRYVKHEDHLARQWETRFHQPSPMLSARKEVKSSPMTPVKKPKVLPDSMLLSRHGTQAYLTQRKHVKPEDRYVHCPSTNSTYGWGQESTKLMPKVSSPFARKAVCKRSFYTEGKLSVS
ncbi:hypothetical protein P9112_006666 [Eukaryota sp. TZLM1-RC]